MTTPLILTGLFIGALAGYAAWWWLGQVDLDEIEPPEGDHYPDEGL